MKTAHVAIYLNRKEPENLVRKLGGNIRDVKRVVLKYKNISKEKFLRLHPEFTGKCDDNFKLMLFTNAND